MRLARALVTIPALVSLALASIALTGARAQSYPGRPVRMIVPYPPAGANDLLARIVGEKLAAMWGQPVVVDNRPGANGLIGVEAAKNSAPDGYTLVMGATGTHAINPVLYRKLPYDAVKDFAPITLLGSAPIVFVVHPSVPVHSIKELVALSHATPGKLNYAAGASLFNLTMELFKSETGADITYVPYRGSVQALTARGHEPRPRLRGAGDPDHDRDRLRRFRDRRLVGDLRARRHAGGHRGDYRCRDPKNPRRARRAREASPGRL
jgi:tripartite-type tricarboxylate transporter receptor subunit TctC